MQRSFWDTERRDEYGCGALAGRDGGGPADGAMGDGGGGQAGGALRGEGGNVGRAVKNIFLQSVRENIG